MRSVVFGNSRAASVLAKAQAVTEWLAVPVEKFGRSDVAPMAGLIAIGDSAAFIDPFTGSGMLLALESGKIAASCITHHVESGPEEICRAYASEYSARFDRRLRFSGLLRNAAFVPLLADMTIRTLSMSSRLQRYVARATRSNRVADRKV
jgi:flavin-dependent dehydrogenase